MELLGYITLGFIIGVVTRSIECNKTEVSINNKAMKILKDKRIRFNKITNDLRKDNKSLKKTIKNITHTFEVPSYEKYLK